MIFSKQEEKRAPYTIEKCEGCGKETKKEFKTGDFVFKETSSCESCKGKLRIEKIFGEIVTN